MKKFKMNKKILIVIFLVIAGMVFLAYSFSRTKLVTIENISESAEVVQPSEETKNNSPEETENEKENIGTAGIENSQSVDDIETLKLITKDEKDGAKETEETEEIEEIEEIKEEETSEIGLVSWGFSKGREDRVDTIIIHSVYNKISSGRYDLEKIIGIFKEYQVAPHYIIDRNGKSYQLVKESNVAYHAGRSTVPDGRENVNNFSIGIELINSEDDEPEKAQYKKLKKLIDEIESRYKIKYILGHSDIAPGRKTDPWNFDWGEIGGKKK